MNDYFTKWLMEQLKTRDWSQSDLAKRAGVSQVTVSRVLNETRKPGLEFCQGVARAFRIPPEQVFRRAGILAAKSRQKEEEEALLHYFDQLPPEDQKRLLAVARTFAMEQVGTNERSEITSTAPANG